MKRKAEEYVSRERVYRAGLVETDAQVAALRRLACDCTTAYGDASHAALRGALADPGQNMEVLLLRQKVLAKDQQIRQLREELEANRFDQQHADGQALMRKCRMLLEENHELGEQLREERMAELRAAVAQEQRLTHELQVKFSESADFARELQQENEKLQGTMSRVAGKLREARAEIRVIQKERADAKSRRKREKEAEKAAADANGATAAPAATSVFITAPVPAPAAQAPVVAEATAPTAKPEKKKKKKKEEKAKTPKA